MRIAAAAYPLDCLADWAAYADKLTRWVDEGAASGANLLVFPEYGAMELAPLGGAEIAADLEASLHEVARHKPAVDMLHARLAIRHRIHILGASGPVFDNARPVNRATLYGPAGVIGHQDKAIMTRFEREDWNIVAGSGLNVFETALGRIGVLICYDSEFPSLGRALSEAGVEILLVPSCTDTLAGYHRVRIGAMARALECQCIAVQSPTVGVCDWSPAVDQNVGRAAVFGPPDLGFPDTGVLAEGDLNHPGWVYADIPDGAVERVRAEGAVRNRAHWPEQALHVQQVTFRRDPAYKP